MTRNRCEHGYVVDPYDPCPECERDALRARVVELEEALQRIVDLPYNGHGYSLVIARAALAKTGESDDDPLRARVAELEETGRALLDAAERHIFSTECQTERDAFRAALKEAEA